MAVGFWTLERTATCLGRKAGLRKPLPVMLAFTDPMRTPDLVAYVRGLPRGATVVYRAFGAKDALGEALTLRRLTRLLSLKLLIGADVWLARAVRADGVHLPERDRARVAPIKRSHPNWIVTLAAHSPRAARARADGLVVSAVFASASPSAGRPLGPLRLAQWVRIGRSPIFALGGVTQKNARRLLPTGVVGLAAIDGFRT